MTEKEIVAKRCPLCVNIQRLAMYLLADDEVILFDWFTIKQSLVFDYNPFYYSLERIEKETRLKRRRIERVIKRFCAMGLLHVEILQKLDRPGRVRYFRMDFKGVVDRLHEIINPDADGFNEFRNYFIAQANLQERAKKGKESKREKADKEKAKDLYNNLNEVYWRRIEMYNSGALTDGKIPDCIKSKTALPFDMRIRETLETLLNKYDADTICHSFTVLCDEFLMKTKAARNIDNLLKYFLTYKGEIDSFSVVNTYIAKFQKEYGISRG